jgi:hypothetical protein
VAEDQALAPGRRPAVLAGDHLAVGPAYAEREPVHQQIVRARIGLADIDHGSRAGVERHHGESTHGGAEPTADAPNWSAFTARRPIQSRSAYVRA